jgi:uncharacterized protein HemY
MTTQATSDLTNPHIQAAASHQMAVHHHLEAASHYEHGQHDQAEKHAESATSHSEMAHKATTAIRTPAHA